MGISLLLPLNMSLRIKLYMDYSLKNMRVPSKSNILRWKNSIDKIPTTDIKFKKRLQSNITKDYNPCQKSKVCISLITSMGLLFPKNSCKWNWDSISCLWYLSTCYLKEKGIHKIKMRGEIQFWYNTTCNCTYFLSKIIL